MCLHCNQFTAAVERTTQMVMSEVWVEEEVDGIKREMGEEEIQLEEHLLISVIASVMIYQV